MSKLRRQIPWAADQAQKAAAAGLDAKELHRSRLSPNQRRILAQKQRAEDFQRRVLAAAQDPEQRAALLALLNATRARNCFAEFCKQAWHVVEPSTALEWNWHHQLICEVLQAMFEAWLQSGATEDGRVRKANKYQNRVRNAVFNLPPGSLKSRLIAVFFHAWCWLRAPGMKIICLSVNEDATMRDARAARDVIRSPWYQRSFQPTWALKGDQDAISNYGNTLGGERLSKPSGSEVVGLRGDLLLIDDANNPHEAEKAEVRDKVNSMWDTNIYNRVNDGRRSMRIGVQQRTHEGDWTGHVLSKQGTWAPENPEGWLHVVLPAEFEPERKFRMPDELREALKFGKRGSLGLVLEDPRVEAGQSVHPERFTEDFLRAERRRWEGTGNYAGQMQQRPALLEGGRVKRQWWRWFRLEAGIRDQFDEIGGTCARPVGTDQRAETVRIGEKTHGPGQFDFDWIVLSIDCAARKTERGSRWGMLAVAGKGARRYVLDDRSQRGSILDIVEVLRDMAKLWEPDKILIEAKAASEDLQIRLKAEMEKGGLPMAVIEEVPVGRLGKEERLDTAIPAIANGLVHLLDGASWLEAFVDELGVFPNGVNDDRVDALTQVLNFYVHQEVDDLPDW